MSAGDSKLIVLAIGGNSLIADPKHTTVEAQYSTCAETCAKIAPLIRQGHRVVITHGNGPQVGFILRRSELASHELHFVPLDSCGADTQGAIGYHIQRALYNCMSSWHHRVPVATVVTQVLVDLKDPSFSKPSKPIGSFMDQAKAMEHQQQKGWHIVEDAGRGYRRVVPSPKPKEILEIEAILQLLRGGSVVVAVGGGGVPVAIDEHGVLVGVEAVIDKDLASSMLARQIGADLLVITTAVDRVYLNYGKPDQKPLDRVTAAEARHYKDEGHFAPGSMLPKVVAALEFIDASDKEVLITDPTHLTEALEGRSGTRIVP